MYIQVNVKTLPYVHVLCQFKYSERSFLQSLVIVIKHRTWSQLFNVHFTKSVNCITLREVQSDQTRWLILYNNVFHFSFFSKFRISFNWFIFCIKSYVFFIHIQKNKMPQSCYPLVSFTNNLWANLRIFLCQKVHTKNVSTKKASLETFVQISST